MTEKKIPAVSIIVPMYNVEKYVAECLDSILAQTFKDYELLVVDDCSSDKSCEIVESYIQKFEGRLNLIKSEKNSGGRPGLPRNIAIDIARGEYIMFVDLDDVITPTALEELYPVAKKFDADLLQCQKYYQAPDESVTTDKKFLVEIPEIEVIRKPSQCCSVLVKEPTLESSDLAERVENVGFYRTFHFPWNRFYRRELLIKHNIKFPPFRTGEDLYFHFFVWCLAKNIVVVPNVFYVWRQRRNSASHMYDLPTDRLIKYWTNNPFHGIPLIDKFMNKFEFFRKHKEYKYLIFEMVVYYSVGRLVSMYDDIPDTKLGGFMPSAQFDEIIRPLLDKVEDKTTLLAVFFNRMNFFQMQRHNLIKKTKEQQEKIDDMQMQIDSLQKKLQDLQG